MKQFPKVVEFHTMRLFVIVANSWIWSGESKQIAYYITGLNTAIFLASLVPRWKPIMQRHFWHDILSGKSYTMLTSVFGYAVGLLQACFFAKPFVGTDLSRILPSIHWPSYHSVRADHIPD